MSATQEIKQQREERAALLRTKAAAALLGVSTTTLWRLEQSDPTFPRKIVITSRCVGWRAESLKNWLAGKEA